MVARTIVFCAFGFRPRLPQGKRQRGINWTRLQTVHAFVLQQPGLTNSVFPPQIPQAERKGPFVETEVTSKYKQFDKVCVVTLLREFALATMSV